MGLVVAMGLTCHGYCRFDREFGLRFNSWFCCSCISHLAFGLGGRQPSRTLCLTDLMDKAKREANQPNPVQAQAKTKTTFNSSVAPSSTAQAAPSAASVSSTGGESK